MMSAEQLIEAAKKKLETEQVTISLAKIEWARILGILEGLEEWDVRSEAAQQLAQAIRKAVGIEK